MSNYIYIGFYSREKYLLGCNFADLLDLCIYLTTGPFSHCIICFDTATPTHRATIDKKANQLVNGKKNLSKQREGYTYMKIGVTIAESNKIHQTLKMVTAHATEFDLMETIGIREYTRRVTTDKKTWFCSSFIGFLLREAGIIHKDIDVTKISVTVLYLLLRQSATKTRVVEQLKVHPIRNITIPTCDMVYMDFRNVDAHEIPVLDIQAYKGR
jgi:hypothetical protein